MRSLDEGRGGSNVGIRQITELSRICLPWYPILSVLRWKLDHVVELAEELCLAVKRNLCFTLPS